MQEFQILDEKRYPLKIKEIQKDFLPYWRFEHRVTVGRNFKQFMVFVDNLDSKIYVEDITGGNLNLVEDEQTWHAVYNFVKEKGFCNMMMPIMKTAVERFT